MSNCSSTTSLLAALEAAGLSVTIVDGRLAISPASRLTADLREAIRAHRDELVAAVLAGAAGGERDDPAGPGRPCAVCGSVRYWRRPTGGWVCATCHPAPSDDLPEVVVLRGLRDTLSKAALEMAEALGWPRLVLDGHRAVVGLRSAWVAFARAADVPTLRLAIDGLRKLGCRLER